MVAASELRIGNWVFPTDENTSPYQVYGIHKNDVIDFGVELYGELFLKSKDICPIPITAAVLEKCLTKISDKEFKIEILVWWSKTHHTDYWFMVKFYEYNATGESHTGWRPYIKKGNEPVEDIFLWGYIKSLHQLQNLYFSLTGEELTFNPTTGTTNAGESNTVTNNE